MKPGNSKSDILKGSKMNEYDEYLKKLAREAVQDAVKRLDRNSSDNDLPPDWTSIEISKPQITDGWSDAVELLLQTGIRKDNFAYNGETFHPLFGRGLGNRSIIVAWRYMDDVPSKTQLQIQHLRNHYRPIPKIRNPFDGSGTDFYYENNDALHYERYFIATEGKRVKIVMETKRGYRQDVYTDMVFHTVKDARRFLVREAARCGWWLINGKVT